MARIAKKSERLPSNIVKRGSSFRVSFMHNRRRITATLPSLVHAIQWRDETLARLATDPTYDPRNATKKTQQPSRVTLNELLVAYIAWGDAEHNRMLNMHADKAFNSAPRFKGWRQARSRLVSLTQKATAEAKALSSKLVLEIGVGDIRAYVNARRKAGKKDATVYQELMVLRKAFARAHIIMPDTFSGEEPIKNPVARYMQTDAAEGVPRSVSIATVQSRQSDIDETKLKAVMNAIEPEMRDYIQLLALTGARRSELCALRWSNLSGDRAYFVLRTSKSGRPRYIYILPAAQEILERMRKDAGPEDKLVHVHPDTITHAFVDACKAVGVTGLRLHDLRRRFAFKLLDAGFDVVHVQHMMGHESLAMTSAYAGPAMGPAAIKDFRALTMLNI